MAFAVVDAAALGSGDDFIQGHSDADFVAEVQECDRVLIVGVFIVVSAVGGAGEAFVIGEGHAVVEEPSFFMLRFDGDFLGVYSVVFVF